MNNFPSNNMYYRHGGRNHDTHSSSNLGSGGSRPQQFWNDSYTPFGKTEPYRQHNFSSQNSWQHQSFPQQWPHAQWMSPNHQTTPFRKDQSHNQKHAFKGGHHSQGQYKYKKSFASYERSSEHKDVKEEDPLPGSEEERKKMLAQETDKVKKCLMTFKNEQSQTVSSSVSKVKGKTSADASYTSKRKESETTYPGEYRSSKEKVKSSSQMSGSNQRNMSHKEKEKGSQTVSSVSKHSNHSVDSSSHVSSKSVTLNNNNEDSSKHTKKPTHTHKRSSSSSSSGSNSHHGSKPSYSLNSRDNPPLEGTSSNLQPSSKSEPKNVVHNKNGSQASLQQKKIKSTCNAVSKQSVSAGTTKQVVSSSATENSREEASKKPCLSESSGEVVHAKIKHLKDRIVRHVLGMTPSHLKDFINKPTSRRFEFAMKHLVKERQELLSKEQRGFANSRIRTQSTGSLEDGDITLENICLDTNVSVDLAGLPSEVIEHLGNLLQVDLLKCIDSNTSEENLHDSYNDCIIEFENLKAFANTLPNNENIFAFIEEKPNIAEIAIKQEVVNPWEGVTETKSCSDQSVPKFSKDSGEHVPQSDLEESEIPQSEHQFDKDINVHTLHSGFGESQLSQSDHNFGQNIGDHILHSDLQESQLTQNDQSSQVSSTLVSVPQWPDNQSRFLGLQEQHCPSFPDDIDSWNKSVSTDQTLQSLELTEKLIDKIEQMNTANAQNSELEESVKNDTKDVQENELDQPVIADSVNFDGNKDSNINEEFVQQNCITNLENNQNILEVIGTDNPCDLDKQMAPLRQEQPNETSFGSENISPTEITSEKPGEVVDGGSSYENDNCDGDVPDIEIIAPEENAIVKDIEIITIPDDEMVVAMQETVVGDQLGTQPHEICDNSDSKMDVDDNQTEENLSSQNEVFNTSVDVQIQEPQTVSNLKTADTFVEVMEPCNNDYMQTEEQMNERALIHDKNLASAIIPETESCEDAPVASLSPVESKYSDISAAAEDLVSAPNLSMDLGQCAESGNDLFGQSLNPLDDTARNFVENETEDCKMLKESEKEWGNCSASEMQYNHQGSGNAEFTNLFCELPDLEPEPVDGEQQSESSIVPNRSVSSKPAGSCETRINMADLGDRSVSCATGTIRDQSTRYSPVQVRVEREPHTAAEAFTQTDLEEELTPANVERMLQLLERSRQLSPQLAKLLRDHFNLIKSSQEKYFEPYLMSRESRRETWNGSKKENKVRQVKVYQQHGGRSSNSSYVCNRSVTETPSLIENNIDKDGDAVVNQGTPPQDDSEETATDVEKTIFLEMLGIDKEIQRLMDQKLRLYMRLRLNMSGERRNVGHYSPRSPPPQERIPSQLCTMSTPISPILNVPSDEHEELPQKDRSMEQAVDKTLLRPPVVILPHSYEKPLYDERTDGENNATCGPMLDAMFPRITGVNKRLKLMDTTVVEQVLNSFTIPDSQDKSMSSKSDDNLELAGSVPQNENYSQVEKELHSDRSPNHAQDDRVDSSSKNTMNVCESRTAEDLTNSKGNDKPRTKKNKAQSKYISEKVELILSENLQSASEIAPDELPAQESPGHLVSHASKSPPNSVSDKNIVNNHTCEEFSITAESNDVGDKTDLQSSETTVPTSESLVNKKGDSDNGELSVPSKQLEEVSSNSSEKTSFSNEVDKANEAEMIPKEIPTSSSKKVKSVRNKVVSSEDSISGAKTADEEKLTDAKVSAPLSKTDKGNSVPHEKQPVTNADNVTVKAVRRKIEVKASAAKESLSLEKNDKQLHDSLPAETESNHSVKAGMVKRTASEKSQQKSKLEKSNKQLDDSLPAETESNHSVKAGMVKRTASEKSQQKSKLEKSNKQLDDSLPAETESNHSVKTGMVKRTASEKSQQKSKLEKSNKQLDDSLPAETESNHSVKVGMVKRTASEKSQQKSKAPVAVKNAKQAAEKLSKLKPSSVNYKTCSVNNSHKSNKNDGPSEKYSRRSRLSKVDKEEPITSAKSSHARVGKLDSDTGFSEESRPSVDTELVLSPRKSTSRYKTAARKSPGPPCKEMKALPPTENESSRTRRKGKRRLKTDENSDSLVDAHASLPSQKDDPIPKRTKKVLATKVHDDGKQNEHDKDVKVTTARKGKQGKVNESPVQNTDFTKPNSTPKKFGRPRRKKECAVITAAATESDAGSVVPEVKKISAEPVEPSSEESNKKKRKRSKIMEDEPAESIPPAKRTKVKESRTSMSEDDQDMSAVQGKRSTRLRRTSARLESDQHGASLDTSDNNQSSGRRSFARSARITKPCIDTQTDSDLNDEGKKKHPRRISNSESVKCEVASMQVVENVEQSVETVCCEEKTKSVENILPTPDKNESLTASEWALKHCSVFLTRIHIEGVGFSDENGDGALTACENELVTQSLNETFHELSKSSLNKSSLPQQEQKHCEVGDALPGSSLSATELRSEWTEIQARHPADETQSNCCTPSYAATDGGADPQLMNSFQVESMAMDDNSISTLVSDSVSMMSDGEQKKGRENLDCDHDSTHSAETMTESTSSQSSRHKTSRKHKREKKSDTPEHLTFETHTGPILHIKTVGRHVLAACEDGVVYSYSLKSGKFKGKYEGHTAAVTCLYVLEFSPRTGGETPSDIDGEHETPAHVFTGSLDHYLRGFVFRTGEPVFDPQCIGSQIQCMDHNWGCLYMGTKLGDVARFNIQKSCIIGEHLKLSSEAILSLIATKEGPRKVLIIGTRSSPIMVRDATNGLLLRSVSSHWGHTAYSLLLENSLVYCGTSTDAIRVFEFTSGKEVCQLKAGCSVVCMTSYNNMLFAGCYDGNIYVFSLQDKKHITTIPGPGKMLLCMDIVKNRVIAGCKEGNKLEAWSFPAELKTISKEAKQHR